MSFQTIYSITVVAIEALRKCLTNLFAQSPRVIIQILKNLLKCSQLNSCLLAILTIRMLTNKI